mmetsp:Transcript_9089/g.26509  ORF Transcript_9089/g.26509 Transcript_9089/m.26509 type:complete len:568 (+) Transcript_9089:1993-3696(+)
MGEFPVLLHGAIDGAEHRVHEAVLEVVVHSARHAAGRYGQLPRRRGLGIHGLGGQERDLVLLVVAHHDLLEQRAHLVAPLLDHLVAAVHPHDAGAAVGVVQRGVDGAALLAVALLHEHARVHGLHERAARRGDADHGVVHARQQRAAVHVAQGAEAQRHAALEADGVVYSGIQVQRQRRRHLRQVRRREEEARVEVDGQVRPRQRRAGEHVHAVVEHRGEVGVHVGEAVEEDEAAHRRHLVAHVRREVRRHGGAVADAEKVERLLHVELVGAPLADVRQQRGEAVGEVLVVQQLLLAPLRERLARVVPQQHLHARVALRDGLEEDFEPLVRVEEVLAHHEVEERLAAARRRARPRAGLVHREVHDRVWDGRVRVELQRPRLGPVGRRQRRGDGEAVGDEVGGRRRHRLGHRRRLLRFLELPRRIDCPCPGLRVPLQRQVVWQGGLQRREQGARLHGLRDAAVHVGRLVGEHVLRRGVRRDADDRDRRRPDDAFVHRIRRCLRRRLNVFIALGHGPVLGERGGAQRRLGALLGFVLPQRAGQREAVQVRQVALHEDGVEVLFAEGGLC